MPRIKDDGAFGLKKYLMAVPHPCTGRLARADYFVIRKSVDRDMSFSPQLSSSPSKAILLPLMEVVRGPCRNLAFAVAGDGAAACLPYARHRDALHFDVGGAAADDLTAVRCGIA